MIQREIYYKFQRNSLQKTGLMSMWTYNKSELPKGRSCYMMIKRSIMSPFPLALIISINLWWHKQKLIFQLYWNSPISQLMNERAPSLQGWLGWLLLFCWQNEFVALNLLCVLFTTFQNFLKQLCSHLNALLKYSLMVKMVFSVNSVSQVAFMIGKNSLKPLFFLLSWVSFLLESIGWGDFEFIPKAFK